MTADPEITAEKVISAYEAGDLDRVEFFELALEFGLSLERIEEILGASDDDL